MVQRLLSSSEFKMDPLVSLYYFAPACAVMNFVVMLFFELPSMTMDDFYHVGIFILIANAVVAFLLNVSVVFLVREFARQLHHTLTLLADWQDFFPRPHTLWCVERYSTRCSLYGHLPGPRLRSSGLWIWHRAFRPRLLQARR